VFEVSVDTRTKGRRLDSYRRKLVDESTLLYDADLLKLPVELTITTGGLFGGRLKAKSRRPRRSSLPNPAALTERTVLSTARWQGIEAPWRERAGGDAGHDPPW